MTKITVVYAVLISVIVGLCGYSVGYNAHHTPKYIYVKYEVVQRNLVKTMKDIGAPLTDAQETQLFQKLKEAKK